MAANLAAVAELLKEHYETPFTDAMDRDITLLNWFKRKSGVGKEHQWKIHYDGNDSVGPYAENTTLVNAGNQKVVAAQTPYKQNWGTVEVTGLAQAATRGKGGYMETLAFETKHVLEDLKNEINNQLLGISSAGSGGDRIPSMDSIIADSGTYANIARGTHLWFSSYVLDNSSVDRPLTLTLMQQMRTELEKPSRKAKTNAILTNRSHWYDYGNLLTEYRRFVDPKSMDGGYTALDFEGIEVVSIPNMPGGSMYFIDSSEWGYYVLQNFETTPKSTNTDSDRFIITHYSTLVCEHTGRQGRIDDLS